jgi:hypothetical protein
VVIVNVTRDDLRDEFSMADEAFALSPISARAAQPREEDYDAISEAFMETSRGRWFLGEYAKRNRNADTRMVLDAVARIEQTIAVQKQPEQPAPDNGLAEALSAKASLAEAALTEALATIRSAVDQAKTTASTALDGLALEEKLAPVRKGARIIHEIAWRWREIGADGRICDLIDSQISAIEAACGDISSTDPKVALSPAFDLIRDRLRELDDSDPAPAKTAEKATAEKNTAEEAIAAPAPVKEAPAATAEMAPAASVTEAASETAMSAPAMPEAAMLTMPEAIGPEVLEPEVLEPEVLEPEVLEMAVEAVEMIAEVTTEAADMTAEGAEAADAHDEAVLDLIALEMGAPDPDFDGSGETSELPDIDTTEAHIAEMPAAAPNLVAPGILAQAPEPIAAPAQPVMMSQPLTQPPIQPAIEPSLGSTLIASGMLLRPSVAPDPLAPIRRMSQAEKIAFFS